MNDTLLRTSAMNCLIEAFGVVDTERFISLVIKEPFDYTQWQRGLFPDMTVAELSKAATEAKQRKRQSV
jgi:hypothetical protein